MNFNEISNTSKQYATEFGHASMKLAGELSHTSIQLATKFGQKSKELANDCWETACQNKKTIAKVAIGTAVVAATVGLGVLFYNRAQLLDNMQSQFLNVAESAKRRAEESIIGGTPSVAINVGDKFQCRPGYTPFKLEIDLLRGKSVDFVNDLAEPVKKLWSNVTSDGLNVFSRFGFHATHQAVPGNIRATFLICRALI